MIPLEHVSIKKISEEFSIVKNSSMQLHEHLLAYLSAYGRPESVLSEYFNSSARFNTLSVADRRMERIPLEYTDHGDLNDELIITFLGTLRENIEFITNFEESPTKNYLQFVEFVQDYQKNNPPKFVFEQIKQTMRSAKRSNPDNRPLQIYGFDHYEKSKLSLQPLALTDCHVTCQDLILTGPTVLRGLTFLQLSRHTVQEAKELLTQVSPNGKNAFLDYFKKLGEKHLDQVIHGIDVYSNQTLRQASEISNLEAFSENIFNYNYNDKFLFVHDQLEEVATYMTEQEREPLWGTWTSNQKYLLLHSMQPQNKEQDQIKEKFTRMITNYVTLEEAKTGLVKTKALDVFFKK